MTVTPAFVPARRHAELVWNKRLGCMVTHEGVYKPIRDKKWKTPDGVGRAKVRREGSCRVGRDANPDCQQAWGLHRHHLVPRDRNGDDVDDNIIPLCHACHDALHSSLLAPAIAAAIRQTLSPLEQGYALAHPEGGLDWLNRQYPVAA